MNIKMNKAMIAPCGMNCALCLAHQRDKNQCLGCRVDSPNKRKSCTNCAIIKCEKRKDSNDFCYDCDKPCARLKNLDKRYRENYNMSMIENLEYIKANGIDTFIESEKKRWVCSTCGSYICVHRGFCMNCLKN